MSVDIRPLTGQEILAAIDDLARLRMAVFAEWPYIYDGDPEYEADYLREFIEAPDGILVAACDGNRIVGAATASPMWAQKEEFRKPFESHGIDTSSLFYFGESVLLPEYRGQGIGHAFFDHREAHARHLGHRWSAFCAVIRPDDHPARPAGYRPLDGFWRKRGYEILPGAIATFRWKDHGDPVQTDHQLQFWLRKLEGKP